MPAVPPPSASQPSILLEQASSATDPLSVRKPEVGKASIRQGNHPYYQVAGKPPIRQPPPANTPITHHPDEEASEKQSIKNEKTPFATTKTVVFVVGFFFFSTTIFVRRGTEGSPRSPLHLVPELVHEIHRDFAEIESEF